MVFLLCILILGGLIGANHEWPHLGITETAAHDQKKTHPDQELNLLQGTWQAVEWLQDGDKYDAKTRAELLKYVRWTFSGDELHTTKAKTITICGKTTIQGQGGTVIAKYRIDPQQKPKQMISTTLKPVEGVIVRAVYEIKGDVLRVCMSEGDTIPSDFSVKPGSGRILITLKKSSKGGKGQDERKQKSSRGGDHRRAHQDDDVQLQRQRASGPKPLIR